MADKAKADKGFLLRVDAATMELLEHWASDEFRSVNGQLQWIIHDALVRYKRIDKNGKPKSTPKAKDNSD